MTRITACTAFLAATLAFAACDTDETNPPPDPPSFTAVTYNLGLAPGFVPAATQRAPLTIDAAVALDADVLCVQEVWLPEHVSDLTAAAGAYPNTVFMTPDAGMTGAAACTQMDSEPLLTCITNNGCDQVCADDLVNCVLGNCAVEFGMLPTECNACLQANVGKPLQDIVDTCQSGSTEYAFGGSFGIGLLSKYPIVAQETLVLDSTTNRRALIYAELDTPLGNVHTFCTHLTAVFADIPYPKPMGSWEEEQAAQIAELISMAEDKAGAGAVMLMGDMNTGPAGSGYIAEAEANYGLFLDAGYENPYTATAGHTCTFCGDNPLIGNDDSESVVIDHVFLRGMSGMTSSAARVMDGSIEVENCGVTGTSAYSDHFGVSVTVTGEAQ